MKQSQESEHTARLGLAIGLDRVVAVELRGGLWAPSVARVHARPLAPPEEDGVWPDLAEALKDLLSTLGASRAVASVALLAPLAKAKVVRTPALRRRDLRSLVGRNARRYFILGTQPVVADAAPVARGRRGDPSTAVATCADRSWLTVIQESLYAAGVKPEAITAAPLALAEAVCQRFPAARRSAALVVVNTPGWSEVVSIRRGAPWLLQPGADTVEGLEPLVAQARTRLAELGEKTETVVLAEPDARASVMEVVGRATNETPVDWSDFDELEPAAVAAYGAALLPEGAPILISEAARSVRESRTRKRISLFGAAAAVLLGLSAALYLVNVGREYNAVAAERRRIAPTVAQALEARGSLVAVRERLDAIAAAEQFTVEWTPAFAALARALPDSAYLISMSAEGFELRLAGIASTAADIVPALESSPLLTNVSLNVARRSENSPGAERFDVALFLDPELTGRRIVAQPERRPRP